MGELRRRRKLGASGTSHEADLLSPGAFLGPWRPVAIDGVEWDVPDSEQNLAEFGYPGGGAAFPKGRLVSISECGSHAHLAAVIGPVVGKGGGEQSLARQLNPGAGGGPTPAGGPQLLQLRGPVRLAGPGRQAPVPVPVAVWSVRKGGDQETPAPVVFIAVSGGV